MMVKAKYKRIGRCQPKKCGAFCCNTCMSILKSKAPKGDYCKKGYFLEFFGLKKIVLKKKTVYIPRLSCKYLKPNLSCAIQKDKPLTCKQFPACKDQEYFKTAKQMGCTYRFVKVKL